jgi:hypothetical protein
MKRITVIDLTDPKYRNDPHIIRSPPKGTPLEIAATSSHWSRQVNINYKRVIKPGFHASGTEERMHFHESPIEEYYIVLEGKLKLLVKRKEVQLSPLQLLKVPSNTPHKCTGYFAPLAYIVFRAPMSTGAAKVYHE